MRAAAAASQPCGALRVILVDDEPTFRASLAEMLRDDGHRGG